MRRTIGIIAAVVVSGSAASAGSSPALWRDKAAVQLLAKADAAPATAAVPPNGILRRAALARLQIASLDPAALRWMAMTASGNEKRRWLQLAETATRRDGLVQLQLVEEAVLSGDPETALTHLDRAWTVYPELRARIAPLLLAAIEDEPVRTALSARIKAGRPWVGALIQTALGRNDAVEPLARTIIAAGRLGDADRGYIAPILSALVAQGQIETATAFAQIQLANGQETVRTAGFSGPTTDPIGAPYTWRLTNDAEVASTVHGDSGLEILAEPGISRVIATRLMPAPARDLVVRLAYVPSPSASNLPDGMTLKLDCVASGKVSRSAVLRAEPSAGQRRLQGRWNNRDCPLTALSLSIDTLRSSTTAGLVITQIAITPENTAQHP